MEAVGDGGLVAESAKSIRQATEKESFRLTSTPTSYGFSTINKPNKKEKLKKRGKKKKLSYFKMAQKNLKLED